MMNCHSSRLRWWLMLLFIIFNSMVMMFFIFRFQSIIVVITISICASFIYNFICRVLCPWRCWCVCSLWYIIITIFCIRSSVIIISIMSRNCWSVIIFLKIIIIQKVFVVHLYLIFLRFIEYYKINLS